MDIYNNYSSDKANGRVELVAAGGGVALARKRWNGSTGLPIEPEIVALNRDDVEALKESLEAQIVGLDELLADINEIID